MSFRTKSSTKRIASHRGELAVEHWKLDLNTVSNKVIWLDLLDKILSAHRGSQIDLTTLGFLSKITCRINATDKVRTFE